MKMSQKNPHLVPAKKGRISHKRFPKKAKVVKRHKEVKND
jgi:hypothetical protein